ncbi:MAG: L-threonylcarbamoyladenylate synthase [Chitinophagales bacterium]
MSIEKDIELCLQALRGGGIILYPTDTIWGIGCDATNEKAVERIYKLKKRSDSKAMIVLVPEERDVLQYVANPDRRVFDYLQEVTKPTTVIYKGAIGLAENIVGKDGSVAMRICKDEFCSNLLKRIRKPLVSTSANISGQPVAIKFDEISIDIKIGVDYIVTFRQEENEPGTPSTIVKWDKGQAIVVRE